MGLADSGHQAPQGAVDLDSVTGSMAAYTAWRTSSWCSTNSCAEMADRPDGGVAMRDGKQSATSPVLEFTAQDWEAFIRGVQAGEFG
jgi:Domain of unknown function (DUF397)